MKIRENGDMDAVDKILAQWNRERPDLDVVRPDVLPLEREDFAWPHAGGQSEHGDQSLALVKDFEA